MQKTIILIITILFLSGCNKNNNATCKIENDNGSIYIDIYANNDDINNIHIREELLVSYKDIENKDTYNELVKQIDGDFSIVKNRIIKEYDEQLDKQYSMTKTIDNLTKESFICE